MNPEIVDLADQSVEAGVEPLDTLEMTEGGETMNECHDCAENLEVFEVEPATAEEDEMVATDVESVLERGWVPASEPAVLAELLGDVDGDTWSPDSLYRSLTAGSAAVAPRVEVLAFPGDHLAAALRPGDVLLRVAPGERGLGHVALLVDGELMSQPGLRARGITPESGLPGQYAMVIEGGTSSHSLGDAFARRITDHHGFLPSGQLILRVIAEPATAVRTAEAEDIAEATQAEIDLGRLLRKKAATGAKMIIYSTDMKSGELNDARKVTAAWAKREDAIGFKPKSKITADNLKFGLSIQDIGSVSRAVKQVGTVLRKALKAAADADGKPAPAADDPASQIGVLALIAHAFLAVTGKDWSQTIRMKNRITAGVDGGKTTGNVGAFVKAIAPYMTNNVKLIVYGCTVARGAFEKPEDRVTTMHDGGVESMCAMLRDALIDEGKDRAEVWGHTGRGHTLRNLTLRGFMAVHGKKTAGVSYAGTLVFRPKEEQRQALDDVKSALSGLGYLLPTSGKALADFNAAGIRAIKSGKKNTDLYASWFAANNEKTFRGDNLSEVAMIYPNSVAKIVREHLKATWTKERHEKLGCLVATGRLAPPKRGPGCPKPKP